jgi:hypothetical protein
MAVRPFTWFGHRCWMTELSRDLKVARSDHSRLGAPRAPGWIACFGLFGR